MKTLIVLFINPRASAERLKQKPTWVATFLFLSIVSMVIMIVMRSHTVGITMSHLPPSATSQDKITIEKVLDQEFISEVLFLPIRLLLGWVCAALVLYFLNAVWLTQEPVRFQHIVSLEIHAEAVMVLARLAAGVVLFSSNQHSSEIAAIPLGLDIIVSSARDTLVFMCLNSVNVFSLWYVVVVGIGLAALGKLSAAKGLITSIVAWSVMTTLNFTVIVLLKENLHLQI